MMLTDDWVVELKMAVAMLMVTQAEGVSSPFVYVDMLKVLLCDVCRW